MPKRPCLAPGCRALFPIEPGRSYCAAHLHLARRSSRTRQTEGRGTAAQAQRFRREVLRRAGCRCEAIETGERCEVSDPRALEAHHVQPLASGGTNDPGNGAALCRRHHRMIEPRRVSPARAGR